MSVSCRSRCRSILRVGGAEAGVVNPERPLVEDSEGTVLRNFRLALVNVRLTAS